ncbi:MAG: sigma-70 family RNA polymerase sigma factor [Planctomycetota bacterium]
MRARAARPDTVAADVEPVAPASPAPSPAERAGHAEDAARAREALASLPPAERRALELAYFGGLSQTEIAATTGEPLGTVKGRTRNALSRLRGLLPRSLGGVA